MKIDFISLSALVKPVDLVGAVAAYQIQLDRDLQSSPWGITAQLDITTAYRGNLPIFLVDQAIVAGTLGYHTLASAGVPYGVAEVLPALQSGLRWEPTGSHELLEVLLDPECSWDCETTFLGQLALIPLEVADPVENDEYTINGIPVSNWVYPNWFNQGQYPLGTQFDFMKRLRSPLTLSPGGYMIYSFSLGAWKQSFGKDTPPHQRVQHPHGRRWKRLAR